jgi:DNA-binding Lrp family transcriptional regulator
MRHKRQNGDKKTEKFDRVVADDDTIYRNCKQQAINGIKKNNDTRISKENYPGFLNRGREVVPATATTMPNNYPMDSSESNALLKTEDSATLVKYRQGDVDDLDLKLLDLLQRGFNNKQMAKATENPLSTIQRRTRLLFQRGLARSRIEQDYTKLGYKKGFLCIQLRGGRIESTVDNLTKINGITSISASIGSFEMMCSIVYIDTMQLWNIISSVQELDNVQEVLWSEEVYCFTAEPSIVKPAVDEASKQIRSSVDNAHKNVIN